MVLSGLPDEIGIDESVKPTNLQMLFARAGSRNYPRANSYRTTRRRRQAGSHNLSLTERRMYLTPEGSRQIFVNADYAAVDGITVFEARHKSDIILAENGRI